MSLGLIIVVLLALAGANSSNAGGGETPRPSASGLAEFRSLTQRAGLTDEQASFLAFVSYGESGLNSDVGLGDPALFPTGTRPNVKASQALQTAEARAARKAYENNAGWLAGCGHPASAYSFGSGGLFAFLPTYALAQFRGSDLACASPYSVFDPAFSVAAAYGFARGLTQRSGYLGTWASLRSGWGLPSAMDDLQRIANKSPRWRRHLRAVGLPESKLGAQAPSFPARDLVAMYQAMQGGPQS